MADIYRDQYGKSIDDYKKAYADARANNDSAGMQAANDGANAIRRAQGIAEEKATDDIAYIRDRNNYSELSDDRKQQIAQQNSYEWHIAPSGDKNTVGTKEWLHAQNEIIYPMIDPNKSYNSQSGMWEDKAPTIPNYTGGYGLPSGGTNPQGGGVINQSGGVINPSGGNGTTAPVAPSLPVMPEGMTYPTLTLPDLPALPDLPQFAQLPDVPVTPDFVLPERVDLTGQVNDYSAFIEEMNKAQKETAIAEFEEAYKKNLAAIERAGAGVEEGYQGARNQTAGASELAARNFNEQAAASGLNSGAGGQAALARGINLQNNLNAINAQEAQTKADLELQLANAETEYNSAIAKAEAEGNYQLAQQLYAEKTRYESAIINAMQQEYNNELSGAQLEYQAGMDKYNADYQAGWDRYNAENNNRLTAFELAYQKAIDEYNAGNSKALAEYDANLDAWMAAYQQEMDRYGLEYQQYRDQVSDERIKQQMDTEYQQWLAQMELEMQSLAMQKATLNADLAEKGYSGYNSGNYSGGYADEDESGYSWADQMAALEALQGTNGTTPSSGAGIPAAGDTSAGGKGYDNGGLDNWQIKQMQAALGVDRDGFFGPKTQAAANGISAKELWDKLNVSGDAMLSESAWNYHKQFGSKTGYQPQAVKDFDNYQDYAKDFLNYALANR